MGVKRRLGAAMTGFAETYGKELEAQKTRKQRQQELDFLEQWRKAQTGLLEEQSDIYRLLLPFITELGAPGGMPDAVTPFSRPSPTEPPGGWGAVTTKAPPLRVPGRGILSPESILDPSLNIEGQHPISTGYPASQAPALQIPPTPSPSSEPPVLTVPQVKRPMFETGVTERLPGAVPGILPENLGQRFALGLVSGLPYMGGLSPTGILGQPRLSMGRQLYEAEQMGNLELVQEIKRQIAESDTSLSLGTTPISTVLVKDARGLQHEIQIPTPILHGQRYAGLGPGVPTGRPLQDQGVPPGAAAPGGAAGQQPDIQNPNMPGLVQVPGPRGETQWGFDFGVMSEIPMTSEQRNQLMALPSTMSFIDEMERLGLILNDKVGWFPSQVQGAQQWIGALLRTDPIARQYSILGEAFAPELRKLSGETESRFTEMDVQTARKLLPTFRDMSGFTEEMFRFLREQIYVDYLSAVMGTPTMTPSAIRPAPRGTPDAGAPPQNRRYGGVRP